MYYDNRLMLIKADRVYAHFLKVQFTVGKMGAHKAAVIELDARRVSKNGQNGSRLGRQE